MTRLNPSITVSAVYDPVKLETAVLEFVAKHGSAALYGPGVGSHALMRAFLRKVCRGKFAPIQTFSHGDGDEDGFVSVYWVDFNRGDTIPWKDRATLTKQFIVAEV